MKNIIFNNALGMIISLLTDKIIGGFTTEKRNNSIIINFNYKHSPKSIELNKENYKIFFNSGLVGFCDKIEDLIDSLDVIFS